MSAQAQRVERDLQFDHQPLAIARLFGGVVAGMIPCQKTPLGFQQLGKTTPHQLAFVVAFVFACGAHNRLEGRITLDLFPLNLLALIFFDDESRDASQKTGKIADLLTSDQFGGSAVKGLIGSLLRRGLSKQTQVIDQIAAQPIIFDARLFAVVCQPGQ